MKRAAACERHTPSLDSKLRCPYCWIEALEAKLDAAKRSAVPTATVSEARAVLLEDALRQAQSTVEFLHGCLTQPGYEYAYPEMTERRLQEWSELAPRTEPCVHSRTEEGCESCADRDRRFQQIAEARAALAEHPRPGEPSAEPKVWRSDVGKYEAQKLRPTDRCECGLIVAYGEIFHRDSPAHKKRMAEKQDPQ
jgi:hypothetical protein